MRTVDLQVLKLRLTEYIRIASGGETLLVTDGGRVVAELCPPRERGPLTSGALLAEAMRRGWLSAPPTRREGSPLRDPVAPLGELLGEMDDDRADR